ncbi:uncharacterized protein LOC142322600 [Lycorma delicatula]|uniref:uncharacterized protein LOC142322600 n=1 Tax=Lycorma delicatula TaxID=130591 RepID=UPI003F50E098
MVVAVVILSSVTITAAQKKWVWGEGQRSTTAAEEGPRGEYSIAKPVLSVGNPDSAKRIPLFQVADNPRTDAKFFRDSSVKGSRPRYQVFEGGNEEPTPSGGAFQPLPPVRPGPFPIQPQTQPQPPVRPLRPLHPPPPPVPGPSHPTVGTRPPNDPDAGILTGPVPSWEKPSLPKNGDPTSFDSCKCVHSFNCKSPGLQFGSCDVGKQYCCYNNPGYGLQSEGGPAGGFGSKFEPNDGIPPVLAGPGGPVDFNRPDFPGLLQGGHPPVRPGVPPFNNYNRNPYNGFGRSNHPLKN